MKISDFDFNTARERFNDFQAKLDSVKAERGKDHPELVKLQRKHDQGVQELARLEKDYLDYQAELEAAIRDGAAEGRAEAMAKSKERCEAIMAVADKYGRDDREIQTLALKALTNVECNATDFKLDLIHLLQNRQNSTPTSQRVEFGSGASGRPTEIDKLRAQLETEDNPKERRNLVKRIKALRNQSHKSQK